MKILAALLLSVFVLAGCGESLEKKLVGNWEVDTSKTEISGDQVKGDAEKQMAMALMKTIALDIKSDKSFDMKVMFPIKGKWELSGNKLTLTPELKEGETMSFGGKSTMEFELDSTGSTMSSKMEEGGMKGNLVMVKVDAAK